MLTLYNTDAAIPNNAKGAFAGFAAAAAGYAALI